MSSSPQIILVVDDDPLLRTLLEFSLSMQYTVVAHENGADAWAWLQAGNHPALVVADLNMPVLDGYQLTRRIRSQERFNEVPIVVLSGMDEDDERRRVLALGANRFLVKPFDPDEVLAKADEMLASKQS